MAESAPQQPLAGGAFFTVAAEFSLEVGGDFVVLERIWENTGFAKGTDAEAFRTVLDYRPQIIQGQVGAFLFRREDALRCLEALDALFANVMDDLDRSIVEDPNTQIYEHDGGFAKVDNFIDPRPQDVRYSGFDWQKPDETKSDRREARE